MNVLKGLCRKISKIRSSIIKKSRFGNLDQPVSIQGLPETLAYDRLNKICLTHFNYPLKQTHYSHLSAWKSSGAYRLHVTLENESSVSLIFKDAIYDSQHIPALHNLPIRPGPSEYEVFTSNHPAIKRLTSKVFLADELSPNIHYQYLLEDLHHDYQSLASGKPILQIIKLLPEIHRMLSEWVRSENPQRIIHFDAEFHQGLFQYIHSNLNEYFQIFRTDNVRKVLDLLSRLEKLFLNPQYLSSQALTPIHGDLNYSNIFIHQNNPLDIKLIDWEWTGMGLPHADLVSLLKGTTPALEDQALNQYIKSNRALNAQEHQRLYLLCKIERGLLDASFLAAQSIYTNHQTNFSLHSAVSSSLNRVYTAHQSLNTQPR